MIIMKFGGTSIATVEAIERVAEIIKDRIEFKPVVVASAMGKTTRNLLHIAQWSAAGDGEKAADKLNEIIQYHHDLANQVIPDFDKHPAKNTLQSFFDELEKLLGGVAVLQDYTPRLQDKFLSYGELISTTIITAVLQSKNVNAVWTDAREYVITDDWFTQAHVIDEITYPKIRETLNPLVNSDIVPVAQGFIGSTESRATTTLGFEGSDFSAALLGAAMQVDDIQLWKDVSGVMTADPALLENVFTIKQLTFNEIADITFFGAKVLHPSSIAPARKMNIPVHVKNSTNPSAIGTAISSKVIQSTNKIKSIAYKDPVNVLTIEPQNKSDNASFVKRIFDLIDKQHLMPYLTCTAQMNTAIAVDAEKETAHFIKDLNHHAKITIKPDRAVITLVGEHMQQIDTLPMQIMKKLDDIPVEMISYGASEMNLCLVVENKYLKEAILRLHNYFFSKPDKKIFV